MPVPPLGAKPALSSDAIPARRADSIEKAGGGTVCVNGDRFSSDGRPSGVVLRNGVLDSGPSAERSSIGIDSSGALRVERIRLLPTWQGTGQRQTLAALNGSRSSTGTSLYTPAWGSATPAVSGSVEVVVRPFAATAPNVEISGQVVEVREGGGTPIPPDGTVLVARGAAAVARVRAEVPLGTTLRVPRSRPELGWRIDGIGKGTSCGRQGDLRRQRGSPRQPRCRSRDSGQLADGASCSSSWMVGSLATQA
jgi:hypothetical protein